MGMTQERTQQLTQDFLSHRSCRRTTSLFCKWVSVLFQIWIIQVLGSTSFWNQSVMRRHLPPRANERGARCPRHKLQVPPSKDTCSALVLVPSGACLLGICLTFSLVTINYLVKGLLVGQLERPGSEYSGYQTEYLNHHLRIHIPSSEGWKWRWDRPWDWVIHPLLPYPSTPLVNSNSGNNKIMIKK